MNKNLTLLFITIVFVFAGCKKNESDYLDESGISVHAYPITSASSSQRIDAGVKGMSSGAGLCLLRASIVAPKDVTMSDHGFIVNSVFPPLYIPMGPAKKRGAISTEFDFGNTILLSDTVVFYAVLSNGDSLRSDYPGVIKSAPSDANLVVSNLTITNDSISEVQLNCTVSFNSAKYYILAQNILYADPKSMAWQTASITSKPGNLSQFTITGNPNVIGFSFPGDSQCLFQIQVILAPINGSSSPVTGTSNQVSALYN